MVAAAASMIDGAIGDLVYTPELYPGIRSFNGNGQRLGARGIDRGAQYGGLHHHCTDISAIFLMFALAGAIGALAVLLCQSNEKTIGNLALGRRLRQPLAQRGLREYVRKAAVNMRLSRLSSSAQFAVVPR
jgi:hypothetical protein